MSVASTGVDTLIPPDWGDLAGYGLLGDYIGGVWGTGLSILALVALFLTFVASVKLNYWTISLSLFTQFIATHDRNAERVDARRILEEFSFAYQKAMKIGGSAWSVRDRIDIAYVYVFYGASSGAKEKLSSSYGAKDIHFLHNELSRKKNAQSDVSKRFYHGHQHSLSHYMRNLFNVYSFIDGLKVSDRRKYELSKLVRTKLSNYDQAVLALNILSRLGREWEATGLVEAYRPICNVPADFYGYDDALCLKKLFPTIRFEWERTIQPAPRYLSWALGRVSIVVALR